MKLSNNLVSITIISILLSGCSFKKSNKITSANSNTSAGISASKPTSAETEVRNDTVTLYYSDKLNETRNFKQINANNYIADQKIVIPEKKDLNQNYFDIVINTKPSEITVNPEITAQIETRLKGTTSLKTQKIDPVQSGADEIQLRVRILDIYNDANLEANSEFTLSIYVNYSKTTHRYSLKGKTYLNMSVNEENILNHSNNFPLPYIDLIAMPVKKYTIMNPSEDDYSINIKKRIPGIFFAQYQSVTGLNSICPSISGKSVRQRNIQYQEILTPNKLNKGAEFLMLNENMNPLEIKKQYLDRENEFFSYDIKSKSSVTLTLYMVMNKYTHESVSSLVSEMKIPSPKLINNVGDSCNMGPCSQRVCAFQHDNTYGECIGGGCGGFECYKCSGTQEWIPSGNASVLWENTETITGHGITYPNPFVDSLVFLSQESKTHDKTALIAGNDTVTSFNGKIELMSEEEKNSMKSMKDIDFRFVPECLKNPGLDFCKR